MADFVAAVDQGTTSTRCMIFDHGGNEIGRHQLEHNQILPQSGWVEHDPVEIWERTSSVIQTALNNKNLSASDLDSFGITNQRETTLIWNKHTGRPYYNAIAWQTTRTDRSASELERSGAGDVIRHKAGLPPATYFSGGKIKWLLDNVDGLRGDAEEGDAIFGNTDAWVLWNLTGGTDGGVHITDVTNASRTMLMNLETLDWDDELLGFLGVPRAMLPEIRPSSYPAAYGTTRANGPVHGEIPITGILGDQQAATVGQVCFNPGDAKNTYGTGNFLILNTGTELIRSKAGLLTTPAYKFGDDPVVYALEGSIAVTGSAVPWLRDQLCITRGACERERPGPAGRGRGRHLLRARLLRPVRALLAVRRPRRDRRAVPVQHQRPPGPGHAGGHLLPEPRRGRGRGAGLRRAPGRAQGRRRRDRQRPVHAAPGGHPRRPGQPAGGGRDHRARRRLRGRPGHRVLEQHRGAQGQLERVQALAAGMVGEAARGRLRRLEEGRPAHPGLGGRRLTRKRLAQDLAQVEVDRFLQLRVRARLGGPVRAPAHELRGVPEPDALHVVVAHLDHPLGAQRHERQVLARVPPAALGLARRALAFLVPLPLPRVLVQARHVL